MRDYPNVSKNNEYLMWRYDGIIVDGADASISSVLSVNGPDAPSKDEIARCAVGQIVNHAPKAGSPNALQYATTLDTRLLSLRMRRFLPNIPFHVAQELAVDAAQHDSKVDHLNGQTDGIPEDATATAWKNAKAKLFARSSHTSFITRNLAALEDMVIRQRVAGVSAAVSNGTSSRHACIESLAIVATRDIEDEEIFINYRFNPASPDLPDWYEDCNPSESKRRWLQDGFWGSAS